MNLIYKLRRELRRVAQQFRGLTTSISGRRARDSYDQRRSDLVRRHKGQISAAPEVAVLLIYQPAGVLGSTLHTLGYLRRHGLAPIVVSNAPLSAEDIARLQAEAYLVIERPNIGYDFGGYREGVLTALSCLPELRALHVMNDSIWFPLGGCDDALTRVQNSDADITGLYMNCRRRDHKKAYLQSYYYRFGPKIVRAPVFERYWRKMPLIDQKHSVVRKFEHRLASYFERSGFTVSALVDRRSVTNHLLGLDDERLDLYTSFQAEVSTVEAARLPKDCDRLHGRAEWRRQIDKLIRSRGLFINLTELHPCLLRELDVPFLKKGRSAPLMKQRRAFISAGLQYGCPRAIAQEIQSWDN